MKTKVTKKKTTRKPATAAKRNTTKQAVTRAAAEQTTEPIKQPCKASKKQTVIDLLQQEGGASLADLTAATGWQAHSVRGFISGTLRKKLGLAVNTAKNDAGETVYRITA